MLDDERGEVLVSRSSGLGNGKWDEDLDDLVGRGKENAGMKIVILE